MDDASGWFARLHADDATPADWRAFHAWHDSDPRHAAAWSEIEAIFAASGAVAMEPRIAGMTPRAPRPGLRPARWAMAAAILLMVGARVGPDIWIDLRADYRTGGQERHQQVLADGSRVELNVDSALEIAGSATERRVRLLRGEAFFEIVPDADRPFVVETAYGAVRVTGTAFAVRLLPEGAKVTVAQGTVEVLPGRSDGEGVGQGDEGAVVLRAGQSVRTQAMATGPVETVDVASLLAWRGGRIVFRQRPLGQVLAELERYRPGMILLLDDTLAQRPVTGAFDIENTDRALSALAAVMKLEIRRFSPLVTVISARS
ncbi:hypothetical protein AUP43_03145 [Oceanibaculum pacificum]|uniref:Iron dicitrate transport regulator FecR n=1 Tax=Oceanibaculum pacificum TaxID=580166 RepID=A0A154VS73_9PROT|nr:hypothetical protein AUP43_03145 [Oceanibaculum pacificum]